MSAWAAFWLRCNMYLFTCTQVVKPRYVWHFIWSMHSSYGLIRINLLLPHMWAPYVYSVCVWIFVSWPLVISDYWPSWHHSTRGRMGSWQILYSKPKERNRLFTSNTYTPFFGNMKQWLPAFSFPPFLGGMKQHSNKISQKTSSSCQKVHML